MLYKRLKHTLPWLWLIFCFAVLMLFLHQNVNDLLDSDMASELVLAKLTADTGKLVPKEWYYSTEVYLLGMQLFYAPFFFLTDSWLWVRLAGTACALLCLLACFYYLCRQLDVRKWFPAAASMLLLPSSMQYTDMVLVGGFYTQYMIVTFLSLAMMVHHLRTGSVKKQVFLLIALALVSMLAGATGLRMLLFLYIPALLCALVMLIRPSADGSPKISRLLISSSVCLVSSGIGYLFNCTFLPKHFSYMQFGEMRFTAFDPQRVAALINDWLSFLGFRAGEPVFSAALPAALLCFVQLLLIVMAVYASLKKPRWIDLPAEKCLPVLVYAFGMLLYGVLLCISDAPYSTYYLVPAAILTPVTLAVFLSGCRWPRLLRRGIAVCVVALVAFAGLLNYDAYSKEQLNDEIQNITANLVNDGYTEGYATFWNGNIITELSSGKIDMRVWPSFEQYDDVTAIYHWLQLKEHAVTVPEGKTFILFSKWYDEQNHRILGQWLQEEDVYWNSKDYLVYGYESYTDLLESVNQQYHASFVDGRWTTDNAASAGTLASAASVSTAGMTLYPGRYSVTVTGEGTDRLNVHCAHADGTLSPVILNADGSSLVFEIQTSDLLHDFSMSFTNTGDLPAVPSSLELVKIALE